MGVFDLLVCGGHFPVDGELAGARTIFDEQCKNASLNTEIHVVDIRKKGTHNSDHSGLSKADHSALWHGALEFDLEPRIEDD